MSSSVYTFIIIHVYIYIYISKQHLKTFERLYLKQLTFFWYHDIPNPAFPESRPVETSAFDCSSDRSAARGGGAPPEATASSNHHPDSFKIRSLPSCWKPHL